MAKQNRTKRVFFPPCLVTLISGLSHLQESPQTKACGLIFIFKRHKMTEAKLNINR